MIGFFIVLILSWVVLRYVAHKPISALGVQPSKQRWLELTVAMLFMAAFAVINFTWQAHFKTISYQVNPDYGMGELLAGSLWVLRAVVFEELLFRGVLLYLLIKYLGVVKACVISAVSFGIYHWFSYEVFGERLILMAYVFLVTGAGGWMFAYAFAKTKSLYAPIGLHFGWNWVTAVVFSSGPIGSQWLVQVGEGSPQSDWATLLFFSLQTLIIPGLVTWYLYKRYRRN